MDAVRVCDSCASLVDNAETNGMTSMAIQLAQGNVSALGSLEKILTGADGKGAARAAVAVGCVDALLRAALCCGDDQRKLAAILRFVANMSRRNQEVCLLMHA